MLIYHPQLIQIKDLKQRYLEIRSILTKDINASLDFMCIQNYVLKGNPIPNRVLLDFINNNISSKIDILDKRTLGVLKRIATGIINNLQRDSEITAEQNQLLWQILISNINNAQKEWYEYECKYIYKIPF